MRVIEVTVFYLEMLEKPTQQAVSSGLSVNEAIVAQGKVNRFLYDLVGEPWEWYEKRDWTAERWEAYATDSNLRTFIASAQGTIAGYFELRKLGAETELVYFGLAPAFIGQGHGGSFLTIAVNTAWDWLPTERVIVNTCTLDHPQALRNYQNRGFSIYKEKSVLVPG